MSQFPDVPGTFDYEESSGDQEAAPPRRPWVKAVVLIGAVLLLLWLVVPRVLDVRAWSFPSESMEPTIMSGSRAVTWSRGETERGDIVTFEKGDLEIGGFITTYVKRVIAQEGETIHFVDGEVLVDGKVLDEPYLGDDVETVWLSDGPSEEVTVPAGHVFVLGDKRNRSLDSRSYGPVPVENILSNHIWVWKSG